MKEQTLLEVAKDILLGKENKISDYNSTLSENVLNNLLVKASTFFVTPKSIAKTWYDGVAEEMKKAKPSLNLSH